MVSTKSGILEDFLGIKYSSQILLYLFKMHFSLQIALIHSSCCIFSVGTWSSLICFLLYQLTQPIAQQFKCITLYSCPTEWRQKKFTWSLHKSAATWGHTSKSQDIYKLLPTYSLYLKLRVQLRHNTWLILIGWYQCVSWCHSRIH